VLRDGDIVNVDLTTVVDGYYGDSSETFMIGAVAPEARELVEVTARAMLRGIAAVRHGQPLQDVARAIEPFVNEKGFSVVRQYTGHGIGRQFHEYYSVYHHVANDDDRVTMQAGMTFTVEPMINRGGWRVVTDSVDRWTVRTRDKSLSAQFEHSVGVTADGCEIFTPSPAGRFHPTQ
jgi:methionyl aminopeptidase